MRSSLSLLDIEQAQLPQPFLTKGEADVPVPSSSLFPSNGPTPGFIVSLELDTTPDVASPGLTGGRITSLALLAMLFLMHPRVPLTFLAMRTLLAQGEFVVHQDPQVLLPSFWMTGYNLKNWPYFTATWWQSISAL